MNPDGGPATYDAEALARLGARREPVPDKGWPADAPPRATIELPCPALVVDADAVDHNVAAMAAWCESRGALLAPHAKTTMAPHVIARQLDAGAWAVSAASVGQARVLAALGVSRILIANQVVDPVELRELMALSVGSPDRGLGLFVDSTAAVRLVADAAAAAAAPPLDVLVEVGRAGDRCGVRTPEAAVRLAQQVVRTPGVRLAGIAAYEGLIGGGAPEAASDVERFLAVVAEAVAAVAAEPGFEGPPVVTAGGSAFYDLVVDRLGPAAAEAGGRLVLRSGCYVTHDHGIYAAAEPARRGGAAPSLRPAIAVRARVLSAPDEGRIIVGAGRRDVSFDRGMPLPRAVEDAAGARRGVPAGAEVVALNDQHAHVRWPGEPPAVGEVVELGISHPCTTLDRWRVIPAVRGRVVVERWPTFF